MKFQKRGRGPNRTGGTSRFFLSGGSKMDDADKPEIQAIVNSHENGKEGPISGLSEEYFASPAEPVACEICGAEFCMPPAARVRVCSPGCKHERRIRYLRGYRRHLKDGRERLLAVFGGKMPTEEEIMEFLLDGKDEP